MIPYLCGRSPQVPAWSNFIFCRLNFCKPKSINYFSLCQNHRCVLLGNRVKFIPNKLSVFGVGGGWGWGLVSICTHQVECMCICKYRWLCLRHVRCIECKVFSLWYVHSCCIELEISFHQNVLRYQLRACALAFLHTMYVDIIYTSM